LVINREKARKAREILGTTTLAATVDAALDEVIRRAAQRRLIERIRRDGGIGPNPEELRRLTNAPPKPLFEPRRVSRSSASIGGRAQSICSSPR
jgi:hypothetical protein